MYDLLMFDVFTLFIPFVNSSPDLQPLLLSPGNLLLLMQ